MKHLLPFVPIAPTDLVAIVAQSAGAVIPMCAPELHSWTAWSPKPGWPDAAKPREERRCTVCDCFQSRYPKEGE